MFRFEDFRPKRTNKLLIKSINVKVPKLMLYSNLKNDSVRYFEKEMLEETLIDIKARQAGYTEKYRLLDEVVPRFLINP
jgi:hypothetical protein